MKKKVKIVIIVASILAAVLAVFIIIEVIKSNEYYSHPLYESYKDDNGIKSFRIDGVEYKLINNNLLIDDNEKGEMIGFLDVNHQPIYTIIDDRNVLSVQIPSEFIVYAPYFRFNYVLPDMSIDNIDKIAWTDPVDYSRKTSNDKDLIDALSYEIDNNKRVNINSKKFNEVMAQVTWIDCYFKDTPGVYFSMCLWIRGDGSFVCNYYKMLSNQYCKIPIDLVERIIGHKIDVDKYIKSIRDTETSLGTNLD